MVVFCSVSLFLCRSLHVNAAAAVVFFSPLLLLMVVGFSLAGILEHRWERGSPMYLIETRDHMQCKTFQVLSKCKTERICGICSSWTEKYKIYCIRVCTYFGVAFSRMLFILSSLCYVDGLVNSLLRHWLNFYCGTSMWVFFHPSHFAAYDATMLAYGYVLCAHSYIEASDLWNYRGNEQNILLSV